jgi:hypothetical protein
LSVALDNFALAAPAAVAGPTRSNGNAKRASAKLLRRMIEPRMWMFLLERRMFIAAERKERS